MAISVDRKAFVVLVASAWIFLTGCPRPADDSGKATVSQETTNKGGDTKQKAAKDEDRSIVISQIRGTIGGHQVENGSAYDTALLDIGDCKKLVFPHDAVVSHDKEFGKLRIKMTKTMAFGGHPPSSMSIREARKFMGIAVKSEGKVLIFATYGEWDTMIEGGAAMRVEFQVPPDVELERREGLSGRQSLVDEPYGYHRTQGPLPAGWKIVPAQPDPQR